MSNSLVPEVMSNGFPNPVPMMQSAVGNAVVARAVQEVQGAIISAKMYPRDQGAALKRIEGACSRTRLAESAMYSFPRGGSVVTGPSIRLAEVIAQNWGNLQFGWFISSQTASSSDVTAYCWDMETNVRRSIEFRVNHIRDTKKGPVALDSERDIYELCANMASRRVRNCVIAVIPSDIVDAAVEAAEKTLANAGDLEARRSDMVKAFGEIGVSPDDIERRLGKKVTSISSTDFVQLRKIYQSIKDGVSEAKDWFESVHEPEKIMKENKAAAKTVNAETNAKDKAAAVKIIKDRIAELASSGIPDINILDKLGMNATSIGAVKFETFSVDKLAAMSAVLRDMK